MIQLLAALTILATLSGVLLLVLLLASQQRKRVFYTIGHDLGRALSLDEVLERIVTTTARAVQREICGVAMVSFREGTLTYRRIAGKTAQGDDSQIIGLDDPDRPEPLSVRENIPIRTNQAPSLGKSPNRSTPFTLVVPLRYLTDTVAVLTLQRRFRRFSRQEQLLMEELAPFYAVFIKNILHREDLEETVAQKTAELKRKNRELTATIQRLNETREQLITSEKMASLGKLVAGVAHEINTPVGSSLTGITHLSSQTAAIAALLESDELSREELDEYLHESRESGRLIEQELRRASQLIRSFKQVSADRSSQMRRIFDVKDYLQDIVLSMRNLLKKRRVQLILDCPGGIILDSYPGSFSQILNNLIMNSLVHAYNDEDTGIMTIRIREEAGDLLLVFSDDGRGIPERDRKKIFDPFFTTAHDRGGTGLGLNIVYNIVTNTLGGQILCESREREGTSFTIRFPAQISDSTEQEEPGGG